MYTVYNDAIQSANSGPFLPFSFLLPCPALPEARLAHGSDPLGRIAMLYRAIDAAHTVCGRSDDRPSVCPVDRQQQRSVAGLLL